MEMKSMSDREQILISEVATLSENREDNLRFTLVINSNDNEMHLLVDYKDNAYIVGTQREEVRKFKTYNTVFALILNLCKKGDEIKVIV